MSAIGGETCLARVAQLTARVAENWPLSAQPLLAIEHLLYNMNEDCKRRNRSAESAANEGRKNARVLGADP